jgi:hypothetical protein
VADRTLIGAEALTQAVHAHADRTQMFGPNPVARIIASLGVDAEEFQAMAQVVSECRLPRPEDCDHYPAGFVDGFVIGIRAARAAVDLAEATK